MSEHNNHQVPEPPGRPVKPNWQGKPAVPPPDGYVVGPRESYYRNRFMVTGVEGDIDGLIGEAPDNSPIRSLPPRYIEEIDLSPRGEPSAGSERLVTRVYPLPEDIRPETMIEAFYRQAASGDGYRVFAEPDYLTGGGQGCIEGGPAAPTGDAAAGESSFWGQWAFTSNGIGLPEGEMAGGQDDIRVMVFDTSPYDDPGLQPLNWIRSPWNLTVCHPAGLPNLYSYARTIPPDSVPPGPNYGREMAGYYRDHGLFVSGLVHAVAPPSNIHLIRVLNEYNLGDVPFLVRALREFLELDQRPLDGTLNGTVVNLSLEVVDERGKHRRLLDRMPKRISELHHRLGARSPLPAGCIPPVPLYLALYDAQQAGAIIVACAGNGSNRGRRAEPAAAPASYPFVIGVAGHNICGERSSFSNAGDIAGPAGDGPPGRDPLNGGGTGNADDWLIGPSQDRYPNPGYMYWMGTSFAAPLVSGLAARALGKPTPPGQVRTKIETDAAHSSDGDLGNKKAKVKD